METSVTFPLGDLIGEIVSDQNLQESFDYVISHLEYPRQRAIYKPWRDAIISELKHDISTGKFFLKRDEVRDVTVKDGPKLRDVQAPRVPKRIGLHAIMVIIEKYTYPTLIKNTAASIKGKGMHWLHHIVEDDLRNVRWKDIYFYKSDINKYYDSIDQGEMKALLRQFFSDPMLLPMLDNFVELMPHGLSKGLRSSQCFANLFLSPVDKEMLDNAYSYDLDGECRYLYYRYCDDVVILAPDKKSLWKLRDRYVSAIERLGLEVKPNEAVRPLSEGLDFLGYIHYGTHSLLRKRIKQNAARKLARVKSRKRRQEIIGSFKGMACHADCKHLYETLTGYKMKKFSEMGVTYTPADGKKRFPGKTVRLGAIVNKAIQVHAYESGIKTSQGEDRYIVSFLDPATNEWGKFFTASEEMKNILDQISDIEDGFPFETTIISEVFDGNKIKYKFS